MHHERYDNHHFTRDHRRGHTCMDDLAQKAGAALQDPLADVDRAAHGTDLPFKVVGAGSLVGHPDNAGPLLVPGCPALRNRHRSTGRRPDFPSGAVYRYFLRRTKQCGMAGRYG